MEEKNSKLLLQSQQKEDIQITRKYGNTEKNAIVHRKTNYREMD